MGCPRKVGGKREISLAGEMGEGGQLGVWDFSWRGKWGKGGQLGLWKFGDRLCCFYVGANS